MTPRDGIVSVVAPVRNASDHVQAFIEETVAVLAEAYASYELIVVDDGSTDGTVDIVQDLLEVHPGIRLICLARSFGEDVAMTAGLEAVIGDVVVTMSPATDPPELIPTLIDRVHDTTRIAVGTRVNRADESFGSRVGAALFYRLAHRLLGVRLPPDATQFRAMDRRALTALLRIKDRQRHLRVLTLQTGYAFETMPYAPIRRTPRLRGRSFLDALSLAIDMSVALGRRPLRIVSILGLVGSLANVVYATYVIVIFLFKGQVAEGWTTLSLEISVMFFLLFGLLAVLSEYIGHILFEIKDRPLYQVGEEYSSSITIPDAERLNVIASSDRSPTSDRAAAS
jgi:glycosyltransferase involved in cell wall biosynthesis